MRVLVATALLLSGCPEREPDPGRAPDAQSATAPADAASSTDAEWCTIPCGCDGPLPCPAPSGPSLFSVCGRIHDLETTEPLDEAEPSNGEPYRDVEVRIHEALGFAADPQGSPPIGTAWPDRCGWFRFTDIPRQASGSAVIAVDDASSSPTPVDDRVLTAIVFTTPPGARIPEVNAFTARRATVRAWSAAAGLDPGFEEIGVYVAIFLDPLVWAEPFDATPAAGVTVTEGATMAQPAKDFYFSDERPLARTTVDPSLTATGANGTALMIDTGIMNHSGGGGEPSGCVWPVTLAASVPGVVLVQERLAICE